MRREGFELSVSKPRVLLREIDGKIHEPFETLSVEVPTDRMGPVMEIVGNRRGLLEEMSPRGEYTLLRFEIPARGLIGIRTRMLNSTQGTAIIHHRFSGYRPMEAELPRRANGVMISMVPGRAIPFALFALQDRAELFVAPGDEVYEGMIVGENARDNDLVVNPTKEKKLTNIRAAGSDENIILKPPRQLFLEAALEYIEDDELVEVTPSTIRLRKMFLKENERRRQPSLRLANLLAKGNEIITSTPLEIEQKYRVGTHDDVRRLLIKGGWEQQPLEVHCDTYLRHPSRDFGVTGEAFRIRRVNEDFWITYKGPKQATSIKTRAEIEIPLAEETESDWFQIWSLLGFRIASEVHKTRESWKANRNELSLTVALDHVDRLGNYVEIECMVSESHLTALAHQTIQSVQEELQLKHVEPRSYLRQILELPPA